MRKPAALIKDYVGHLGHHWDIAKCHVVLEFQARSGRYLSWCYLGGAGDAGDRHALQYNKFWRRGRDFNPSHFRSTNNTGKNAIIAITSEVN
jgi:hypothetical protein